MLTFYLQQYYICDYILKTAFFWPRQQDMSTENQKRTCHPLAARHACHLQRDGRPKSFSPVFRKQFVQHIWRTCLRQDAGRFSINSLWFYTWQPIS